MQEDFHYYATYCAAYLAGYTHEESLAIGYCSQMADCCSEAFLRRAGGPLQAATTQTQIELADARTDLIGLQNITRIWASFHFLPAYLDVSLPRRTRRYMNKYRLICDTNSALLKDTVTQVRGQGLQACGLAMHVLADTWAHRYFAGTPSYVINNAGNFRELRCEDGEETQMPIRFRHNPTSPDDVDKGLYTNTIYQNSENSIMNLGHGRAGHLPDYSYARYIFMPSWGGYSDILKDNPADYYLAFCQMIYAMRYLRGEHETFETGVYDEEAAAAWKEQIMRILKKRQPVANDDWKALGEEMSGKKIDDFDLTAFLDEYTGAPEEAKDDTFLGRFFLAAMAQKSLVTNRIFQSGNLLAGFSVDYDTFGFRGIKEYSRLIMRRMRRADS